MIPSSYTIANFKAIGPAQTIELKPITLIFGKNSAGKSSIIQSLLLCRHAIEKGNFNFTSTKRWGQTIDLGGFRQYIHRHDPSKDLTVEFGFRRTELEMTNSAGESEIERVMGSLMNKDSEEDSVPIWSFCYFNFLRSISVRVTIGIPDIVSRGSRGRDPVVKELQLIADDSPLLSFFLDNSGRLVVEDVHTDGVAFAVAAANLAKDYLECASKGEGESAPLGQLTETLGEVPSESTEFRAMSRRAVDTFDVAVNQQMSQSDSDGPRPEYGEDAGIMLLLNEPEAMARLLWIVGSRLRDELRAPGRPLRLVGSGLKLIVEPAMRLPLQRHHVRIGDKDGDSQDTGTALGNMEVIETIDGPAQFFLTDSESDDDAAALAKALRFDLEMLSDSVFDSLRHWLTGTEYIGPYRAIPGRFYQISDSEESDEVDQGYLAIKRIADDPQLVREITEIFQDVLESPYRLEVRTVAPSLDHSRLEEELKARIELSKPADLSRLKEEVGRLLDELSAGKTSRGVYLVDTLNDTEVDFCDVGFGIGQVLPLVVEVATTGSAIVCIEQPEVHLHPKMQSDLADLFVREKKEGAELRNPLFLLETHSEHLILRLLRRIRETSRNQIAEGMASVTPNDVSVVWVEPTKGGSRVTPLAIDEQGRFIDDWPQGFFEGRLDEMF